MCDSVVVVSPDGVLFGKNSDRDPNEAQRLEWHPRARHAPGDRVSCTWIGIPQVETTFATLISRPYWMWGAEMGANEHRVVIGNEAVFTRRRREPAGLLGMDLLRLALERATNAEEATRVIIELLARHGQGGRASYDDAGFGYDNSFLVADPTRAFVVETTGRDALVEEVQEGARAISNALTLEPLRQREADWLRGTIGRAAQRRSCMESIARRATRPEDIATALRSHGARDQPHYDILTGALSGPCMHAGGLVANSQTVASWISLLAKERVEHFVTATAAPCLSAFKRVRLDLPIPLGEPTGVVGDDTWWRFERLHRTLIGDSRKSASYRLARDEWERATWSGERSPERAFAEWDAFVASAALRWGTITRDERPAIARRYWRKRQIDSQKAVPKLPPR